ncbi:MAG: hypothetical protein CLLPBCKN_002200 [Chroococcidiopsis cubana SAG 39.79]|nr:hypothetical protein [Chroococcidiopsis cubana SAG 39.79]
MVLSYRLSLFCLSLYKAEKNLAVLHLLLCRNCADLVQFYCSFIAAIFAESTIF